MLRHLLVSLVLVALGGLAALGDAVLEACGSKFLVSSRGARYQRVLASIQPTTVLFYWPQDEGTPEEERWDPAAEERLEETAGHTVEVAFDDAEFLSAARTGEFEVLVVPIDDAKRLRADLQPLSGDSAVVPLLMFPTRREYTTAREEYGIVLKLPTTSDKFLAALEKGRRTLTQ